MFIKDFAVKTGVSIRTLRYYDEIGLLTPTKIDSGYRIYTDENYIKMQQIKFFKEMGFKLTEIKSLIDNPNFDKNEALNKQLDLLYLKKNHLEEIISHVKEAIRSTERGEEMKFETKDYSKEIEEFQNKYKDEVEEKYGKSSAYKESKRKTNKYTKNDWNRIMESQGDIFLRFSYLDDYKSNDAQKLVKEWQDFITNTYYNCTDEILKGLGELYIADERFTKNIDKIKPGLALFISNAIKYYIDNL